MILRNLIFKLEVIKQRLPAGLVSHHEQASKANREQQHRVLWPAYNPDLAPRQASTEGLFQQTRLIASVENFCSQKPVKAVAKLRNPPLSLQLRVLRFDLFQNGDVGVGLFHLSARNSPTYGNCKSKA